MLAYPNVYTSPVCASIHAECSSPALKSRTGHPLLLCSLTSEASAMGFTLKRGGGIKSGARVWNLNVRHGMFQDLLLQLYLRLCATATLPVAIPSPGPKPMQVIVCQNVKATA